LLDGRELWAKTSGQWASFIRFPRVFYELICSGQRSLFSGTDQQSIQNRIAVAIAADAVLAASSRNQTAFTPGEVEHSYEVGIGAIASLYLDGDPIAAYWYAKLTHMSRAFENNYFVSDYEALEPSVAERLVQRFVKAESIARRPEEQNVPLPVDNYFLAAQQAACHVRTLGHMGDLENMRRLYDEAIEKYPHEIRLPYWRGMWEFVGRRTRVAEHYLNKAASLQDTDAAWGNREIKRLVHCMLHFVLKDDTRSDEARILMRDSCFWAKLRCSVPLAMSRFFDPVRRQMGLPPLASLRVA
jgi:hypothetical protein